MRGYAGSIERDTERNDAFRRELATAGRMQLVLMTLMPDEEVGSEIHAKADQFFRIESGEAILELGPERQRQYLGAGGAALIPAGTRHNIINAGRQPLRLYTLYSPPEHAPGTLELAPAPGSNVERSGTVRNRRR